MSIDNSTVRKVAQLARIDIQDKVDEEKLIKELNNILGWIGELKKIDTKNVEPMLSVFNESMPQRKDKPSKDFTVDEILENAPEKNSNFFIVPKVVE
tara:strand:+ start:639 stop:929 length:291 start_codon:yes stop_codon:yes gene_type:complete